MKSEEQAVLFKVSSVAINSPMGVGKGAAQAKAGYRLGCNRHTDWASQDWQYSSVVSLAERKLNQIAWLTCEFSMLDVCALCSLQALFLL